MVPVRRAGLSIFPLVVARDVPVDPSTPPSLLPTYGRRGTSVGVIYLVPVSLILLGCCSHF